MHLVRNALALTVALAASLPLAGCAVDATDADVDFDLESDGPALEAETWTIGTVGSNPTWDSGEINNLSDWKYIKCTNEYGNDYMLTGLDVWKESTGNLDNFIGKMSGVCSEFNLEAADLPRTGASVTKSIFTSTDYRAGVIGIDIPTVDAYPIGVSLYVNNADGYVKDIRLLYTDKDWQGLSTTTHYDSWATGYTGTYELLKCGSQEVMTGLQLKYDTSRGKIRFLEVFCRNIDDI